MSQPADVFGGALQATIALKLPRRRKVVELLTSGTTWTRPADVFEIEEIIIQGAAGSGATDDNAGASCASGAGPGATIILYKYAVSGNITYAIGAGGAAVVAAFANGNDGGNTTWDGITAGGGKKGTNNSGGGDQPGGLGGTTPNLTTAVAAAAVSGVPPFGAMYVTTNRIEISGAPGGSTNAGASNDGSPFVFLGRYTPGGQKSSPVGAGGGGSSYFGAGSPANQQAGDKPALGAGSGGNDGGASIAGGNGAIELTYWTSV